MPMIPRKPTAGFWVTVALVVALARVGRSTPVTTMLLAGVAVGSLATSLTTFWMLRSPEGMRRAFNWLLGGGQNADEECEQKTEGEDFCFHGIKREPISWKLSFG